MAEDNARPIEESGATEHVERSRLDRSCVPSRQQRDQRGAAVKVKDKLQEGRLPSPPPDPPQCPPSVVSDRTGVVLTCREAAEDEEDLAVYLGELGASPFDGRSFDYDTTPNSATSAMGGDALPYAEEAFEHLDRLCALTEQILELRDRSSRYFRRVRDLERANVQRNADRRLEIAMANDGDDELLNDFADEDTGFAESLLDAMLSNCRDAASAPIRRSERANVRSPSSSSSSSSRQRSRSLALAEQNLIGTNLIERTAGEMAKCTARNAASRNGGGPKISKWTRVKAAFKWERACTSDLADIAESDAPTTASSTPTTRYLRIPDAITAGSWSTGSALSPCTSELSSPSTPIGRVSPASSSNEEVFDDSRKNIINYPDRHSPLAKDDRKKDDLDKYVRSFDRDTPVTESADSIESSNEASRGKPLIRIISDADAKITSGEGKEPEMLSKRPTPILTITIPSNEEEIRNLSSSESMSPLLSTPQDSGGSSPQRPKTRQDILSPREFKRQYSTIEETPAPKIQQQDSKWNKVRRAFLTNATFSVPPSPVRTVTTAQSFTSEGINSDNHCREREASRDYQALREKFGAEFHRKLIEWERLKGSRNARDGLPLSEERLAPEFRKKLQDWKRAKKGRRSSAAIEQQRVSRRRLTDWQLWRSSSSKPESKFYGKNQNSIGLRGSCASIGSAASFGSDGKQHLCEDFIKRMEAWRRMSEAACRSNDRPKSPTNRVASDIIDEMEFLTLEKLLLLFGQRTKRERQESDAKQLNDCFDGDSRFMTTSRGVSCGNEVLIRTSVGSYRFEGISREFTRKLYDWEKYRGISPRSSTFRLLGPGYTPFAQDSDDVILAEPQSTTGKNRAFHWSLKRSKSDGSVFEGGLRDQSFALRRSTSLQSLTSTDKLNDNIRMGALPTSNNTRDIKDPSEDTTVEDSEPEAMIVDIEDVIEETASPLTGVQPHQTPVYSVAASETTSIAVPLGTVTSSHEPSPVFLVDVEEDEARERKWNGRRWIDPETRSNENSPSPERFPVSEEWCEKAKSSNEDKTNWQSRCEESGREDEGSAGWSVRARFSIADSGDSDDRSIGWNRDAWNESGDEANRDSTGLDVSLTPIYESRGDAMKQGAFETDRAGSARFTEETSSNLWSTDGLTDSPRTCEGLNETNEIEDLADESNNERTREVAEIPQNDENDGPAKREKIILSTDFCTYQLAKSSSDCRDSKGTTLKLSHSNLDDKKDILECCDTENEGSSHYENCSSPEFQTDVDRHYEILTFKTHTMCGDTIDDRLYEPIDCQEIHDRSYDGNNCVNGNFLSKLTNVKKESVLTNSTVQTVPVTVSTDNETRRLEKILINERTMNKIIVPTANAESGIKFAERIRDRFAKINRSDETTTIDNRASERRDPISDHQIMESIKKDTSSTKSVFVKTKRMIFGPFRRSEDRPSSRKQSDSSINDRILRSSKSKSKSRSASPKLCRQDALLRMSLSLPWPLRSVSKDTETSSETGSRRSSAGKTGDCEENNVIKRKLNEQPIDEVLPIDVQERIHQSDASKFVTAPLKPLGITSTRASEQFDQSRTASIVLNQNMRRLWNDVNRGGMQNDGEHGRFKYGQGHFEGKRDEMEKFSPIRDEGKQDETRQQNENHVKCDAVPSDLMHKLRILSDAAARKEGRVSNSGSPVISSTESRSSRIRRAKESFLSRRGGPFCRIVTEPTDNANSTDPWRRTSTTIETSKSNDVTMAAGSNSETTEKADGQAETTTLTLARDVGASSNAERIDEGKDPTIDGIGVRSESLVKSASAGMINVDPDTFDRLVTSDRGCESLPRTIAKRRDTSGPLAKIVGKLRFSRLIRARNIDGGNMSTISTLCRQSLLIDTRDNPTGVMNNEREAENDMIEAAKDEDKNENMTDCHSAESSKDGSQTNL